jgi:carbamoyl-phosphate synthase large subunit
MRSLETGKAFGSEVREGPDSEQADHAHAGPSQLHTLAMVNGYSVADIHEMTSIDPWFLEQMKEVVDFEAGLPGPRWLPPERRCSAPPSGSASAIPAWPSHGAW